MGTNYYLYNKPDCSACGRSYEPMHIGKSSSGWHFSLHVIPDDGIHTLSDWVSLWSLPRNTIKDEYGDIIKPMEMMKIILERKSFTVDGKYPPYYNSRGEFLEKNQAEEGLFGLLRHKIDNRFCIGHSNGTYDFMLGEFC